MYGFIINACIPPKLHALFQPATEPGALDNQLLLGVLVSTADQLGVPYSTLPTQMKEGGKKEGYAGMKKDKGKPTAGCKGY